MSKTKINEIIVSTCLFILGICLLLWADKVTDLVSLLFGSILILYGIINGISYIKNKERDTVSILSVVILLVVGIVLVSKPTIIGEIISFIVGFYIILSSISNLKIALYNKQSQNYKMGLCLSIIGIVIGILCIIGKILIPNLILRFIGLMLIIFSIIDIIDLFLIPTKKYVKIKE